MTEVTSHAPGAFCWIELATSDAPAARQFYTNLFGWSVAEQSMGEMGTYYIFQKNGRDAAAMYQKGADQKDIPPNWLSYVCVSSADAAADRAKSLGGNVVAGPFDVFDMGRMAVVTDPQGATFAVWEAKSHAGIGIRDEPATLCWNELQARDLAKAKQFYRGMFGWQMKESEDYNELSVGEQAIGGIMESKFPPGVPSAWLPYFAVNDCDQTTAKAGSIGASVMMPPMDLPNVGRFSLLSDPQGAVFYVIQLKM